MDEKSRKTDATVLEMLIADILYGRPRIVTKFPGGPVNCAPEHGIRVFFAHPRFITNPPPSSKKYRKNHRKDDGPILSFP